MKFLSQNWILIFTIVIGSSLLLTMCSVWNYLNMANFSNKHMVLEIFYVTGQMLTFESANMYNDIPFPLPILFFRLWDPFIIALAAFGSLFILFYENLERFFQRFKKNHIVIVGWSKYAEIIIKSFKNTNKKNHIVVISNLSSNNITSFCENWDVPVLHAVVYTSLNKLLLRNNSILIKRASISKAKYVFVINENDEDNVFQSQSISNEIGQEKSRKIFCHIRNNYMRDAVNESPSNYFLDFDLNKFYARDCLIDIKPLYNWLNKSFKPVEYIILGFGSLGKNIVEECIRVSQYSETEKVKVTIVDKDAQLKSSAFFASFPEISNCSEIKFIEDELLGINSVEQIKKLGQNNSVRGEVIIAVHNDFYASEIALRASEIRVDTKLNIRVPSIEYKELGIMDSNKGYSDTHFFGKLDDINDKLIHEVNNFEKLSRYMHERYLENSMSTVAYDKLSYSLRISNYHSVCHFIHKLHCFGIDFFENNKNIDDIKKELSVLFGNNILKLSQLEHLRWNAERWLNGWMYGPEKEVDSKIHSDLVSWEELPDSSKEFDNDVISVFGQVVQEAAEIDQTKINMLK